MKVNGKTIKDMDQVHIAITTMKCMMGNGRMTKKMEEVEIIFINRNVFAYRWK